MSHTPILTPLLPHFKADFNSRTGYVNSATEPVFIYVYGDQESILINRFRQPMQPAGPVRQLGLSYRPDRLGIDSWAPSKVYKYGLRCSCAVHCRRHVTTEVGTNVQVYFKEKPTFKV